LFGLAGAVSTALWISAAHVPDPARVALSSGAWLALAFCAALTTVNLMLRWFRWHFLIRRFTRQLGTRDSLAVYLATLPAIVTPFFVGELSRVLILRRQSGARASHLVEVAGGEKKFSDTNYIFLSFVTRYLPMGVVGLVIAVIFAATMSASSGEINSLATVSVVDLYQRYFHRRGSDHHYLMASRFATLFWGIYAVAFAGWGKKLGSLIVAVNVVGSLFYGSLLGCFVLAFGFRRVRGTATFTGMLAGEAVVFWAFFDGRISYLWYNAIGCLVVVGVGLLITFLSPGSTSATPGTQPAQPPQRA